MEPNPEQEATALRAAASATADLTGEALDCHEAIDTAQHRLTHAWTGSMRHEPATATAYAAEASRKITEGISRLHRAVASLNAVAARLFRS